MVTSNAPLRLSVAICTLDRAESLRNALERLTKLRVPRGVEWHVVVVNNGSSDHTQDVLDAFAGRLPLVGVFEPTKGLSNARNRALKEAIGDYVLWIDDDVMVDEDWLEAYVAAIRENPDCALFGGPVRVQFVGQPPRWLVRALPEVGMVYCMVDHGEKPVAFDPKNGLIALGSNYAVRLAEGRMFPYDVRIGAGSEFNLLGEETTKIRALLAAGHKGIWVPNARVDHVIPKHRQTARYVYRWFEAYGATLGYFTPSADSDAWARLFGIPRWMLTEIVQATALFWIARPFAKPEIWSRYLVRSATCAGQIRIWRQIH